MEAVPCYAYFALYVVLGILFIRYRSWYIFRKIQKETLEESWAKSLVADEDTPREEVVTKIASVVQERFERKSKDGVIHAQSIVWPLACIVLSLMAVQSTYKGAKHRVLREGLSDKVGALMAKSRSGRGKAEQGALSEIERDVESK